jgi:ribose transport system ATP-binding protein
MSASDAIQPDPAPERSGPARSKVLEIRGLTKEYPGVRALSGVDFDVVEGEIHCVVGPNGAGKSTLIKCVSGVVEPTGGEILVGGEPLPPGDPGTSLAMGVSTIYQELDLVPELSVAESVFLGHEPRRARLLDLDLMRRETGGLLGRLGHEKIPTRVPVGSLRPAAQQVVSIARALSQRVRLLIMDEPSAILGEGEIETLFGVVRRLTAEGVGVVYISHRLDEIRRIGDRVTVLTDGRTVASGLPASTSSDRLVEHMVGRKVDQLYPERLKGNGQVLLDVRNLRRLPAVRGVSLKVHAGEVVGLGGLVGSGRSELLRLIYGLDQPEAGEVWVEGHRLPASRPDRAIAAGLGLAPEDRKSQGLVLHWSLVKNVTLADLGRFTRRVLINRGSERSAAREQLRALHTVPDDADRVVRLLSGGNQQKVVLARWLLRKCRVLLLDEPTRGVDVATKAELYRVFRDLAKSGIGVLVVSSELEELAGICSRVLVMREGKLVAEVEGGAATELELLRHAVARTDAPDLVEEIR